MVKIPVNKVMTQLESYYILEVKLYRYNAGLANRKQIASGGLCEQVWRKDHLLDQQPHARTCVICSSKGPTSGTKICSSQGFLEKQKC